MDVPAIEIPPDEIIEDRPFTHPGHTEVELPVLEHMLEKLRLYMKARREDPRLQEAEFLPEADGRSHRYFVPRPPALMQAENLAVVGFFGQKRVTAKTDHFGNIGNRLMVEIPGFEKILSYSTMELHSGDFANLVLLIGESVKETWRHGRTHSDAVHRSPTYYESIRIYNGELQHAITPSKNIRLTRVKYWDYGCHPTWRGVRRLV